MTFEEIWPEVKRDSHARRRGWHQADGFISVRSPKDQTERQIVFCWGGSVGVWFPGHYDLFADDWEIC